MRIIEHCDNLETQKKIPLKALAEHFWGADSLYDALHCV